MFACLVEPLVAQQPLQQTEDFRNRFSAAGAPAAAPLDPLTPALKSPLRPAYLAQWTSGTAHGSWATTRLFDGGQLVAGLDGAPGTSGALLLPSFIPRDANGVALSGQGVRLQRAAFGRPAVARSVAYSLGAEIRPPEVDGAGAPVTSDFYLPQPVNLANNPFVYWSPHARVLYAIRPGLVTLVWKERISGVERSNSYVISSSAAKPERKLYWTENGYNGPPVQIPAGLVQEVKILYTDNFPETVTEPERPWQLGVIDPAAPVKTYPTLYYQQGYIRAYNREGRVFVEYLGAAREDGTRQQVGYDIVNVIREVRPTQLSAHIGDYLRPPEENPGQPAPYASVAAGLYGASPESRFLDERYTQGGTVRRLYAIRQTVRENQVLVYWMERGDLGLLWPDDYTEYQLSWPATDTPGAYSTYLRPDADEDPTATAVALDLSNNPELVYQDDPSAQDVAMLSGGRFVASLSGENPEALALIRYTVNGEVWYERVRATLSSAVGVIEQDVDIGQEIVSPVAGQTVGYIHAARGDAYNVRTYIDPFVSGFEAASRSAIFGVNALPGKDRLEIWWYKRSDGPGPKFAPTYWPAVKGRYRLRWPASAQPIILASNAGSDDLPSLQAAGSLYVQNNPLSAGYNPNEEHALMLGGRVWALRDDLNTATSSRPFVLLGYAGADGRPAMRVFSLSRGDFTYAAEAGKIVQSPMPLPLLPAPLDEKGRTINVEVGASADLPAGAAPSGEFARYGRFTFADRKGATWVYRGPHAGNVETSPPSFGMRFFYATQPDFNFPGVEPQPPVGTLTPYLRPYVNPADPEQGFVGDPVSGRFGAGTERFAQTVAYVPRWPVSAPELRLGETLVAPKAGLPALLGQTSAEILYQQSIALDGAASSYAARRKSAILHDYKRSKRYALAAGGLSAIPAAIATTSARGKTYFSNLPPHLKERLYFDPTLGGEAADTTNSTGNTLGALVLIGSYEAAALGESYVQPSVLSAADLLAAKALLPVGDPDKTKWDAAIDGLSARVETFVEDQARLGTYKVDSTATVGAAQPVEITNSDTAASSYALTATGGGDGYVVLVTGNGRAFTPPGEPVSLHVLRVTEPLYRGEIKVVAPANPLDEKLTLQFSGDFAGRPQDYEFEWRYGRPVEGVPPPLFTFQAIQPAQPSGGVSPWTLYAVPQAPLSAYRGAAAPSEGVAADLAGGGFVPRLSGEPVPAAGLPDAVLRRSVEFAQRPLRLFVSLDLDANTGVAVYLNNTELLAYKVPGRANTGTVASFPPLSSLPLVFEVDAAALQAAGANTLSADVYTTNDPGALTRANIRLEGLVSTADLSQWLLVDDASTDNGEAPGSEQAKVRHIIEGSSLFTLTDNYFITRYRPRSADAAGHRDLPPAGDGGWSPWTQPQLAEGWIKRVLAGINPFQQRVNDLYNFEVNTDVSLVAQAGTRWEGDVALSLDNINDVGLIPIYETVLRRGRSLSIDGTPPINDPGANDALLLAAGYLNDLYMILGNEAYADASDPTIAIDPNAGGTSGFSEVSTAMFSFKGVVPTVLEEELALVRGRDDFLQPGTRTAPVYNRLVWNYTRGIDSGEVIYALNYNILDQDQNGQVNAADAARLYPQGHGDAYGHYLTALTNYYGLLQNPNFSWTPRSEAVLVLGQPVQVDYFDERKFAAAAAALARTGKLAVDLSYRRAYSPSDTPDWKNLRDGKTNTSTGRTRYWGADEWASRAGQGAYFNWITAQSLLPAVHPNPAYEGIQKIDRTTVPELKVVASEGAAIQAALDKADSRLNPLGLSAGALAFDYDPSLQSKPPFEQIYDRAIGALQNAVSAFQNAERSSRALRQQETSLDNQRASILVQETAFTNRLIELYGTPYPDDIGPGKTYPEGYSGPDLFHPMYVDITEDITGANLPDQDETYSLFLTIDQEGVFQASDADYVSAVINYSVINGLGAFLPNFEERLTPLPGVDSDSLIEYTVSKISGEYRKPDSWTGRRASPGKMQTAVSDLLLARQDLQGIMYDYGQLHRELRAQLTLYTSALAAYQSRLSALELNNTRQSTLDSVNSSLTIAVRAIDFGKLVVETALTETQKTLPTVVGLATDIFSPIRGATGFTKLGALAGLDAIQFPLESTIVINEQLKSLYDRLTEIDIEKIGWSQEQLVLRDELRKTIVQYGVILAAVDKQLRVYDQAQRDVQAASAEGLRILAEREAFRKRAAALIQGQRTRDFAYRAFRNEALEKYHQLFDLAAQYTYLAARTYDYETGLLDASGNSAAADFFAQIVRARSLGVVVNGVPQFTSSSTGDPGLAGVLAALNADWSVAKTRLGFNNPDRYRTTFSLRRENFRIVNGPDGDKAWRDRLKAGVMPDILADPDVRRFAMQPTSTPGERVPGIVIPFETTIQHGVNFFGRPLSGGDSTFSPSTYSTKIRSSGIAFAGYVGMATTTSTSGTLNGIGATSPSDPSTAFNDPNALSATPYVYLIPAGTDFMRAPPLGDRSVVRGWQVEDQAIPLPINIAGSDFSTRADYYSAESLSEPPFVLRKHQAFRAIAAGLPFYDQPGYTNSRLIGRSVWNSRWKLVIPGNTLLSNPDVGVTRFTDTVKDIQIYFETYSHAGN